MTELLLLVSMFFAVLMGFAMQPLFTEPSDHPGDSAFCTIFFSAGPLAGAFNAEMWFVLIALLAVDVVVVVRYFIVKRRDEQ